MTMLPYARHSVDQSDIDAVTEVLKSGFLTQGPKLKEFEAALAEYLNVKHAIAVSNGTAALHLSVAALGFNEKSIGVTSPLSFSASSNCFLYTGGKALFCDVNPETGLMDPFALENLLAKTKKSTLQTCAIIPVSLHGSVPNLPEIRGLAEKYGYYLIEDAAQSFEATYEFQEKTYMSGACAHTDLAVLSFHPLKHITASEGGAVLTNDNKLAEKVRQLRTHGFSQSSHSSKEKVTQGWYYNQSELGWNYRFSEIQAALGLSQLKRSKQFLERRQYLAQRYIKTFSQEPFVHLFKLDPKITNPEYNPKGHSHNLFVIHFDNSEIRDRAHNFLKTKNIYTQVHHLPIYKHLYYQKNRPGISLPNAEQYFEGILSIPLFPGMTDSDQDSVVNALYAFSQEFAVALA